MLDQPLLRVYHVTDGDNRETHAVGLTCARVDRRWSRAPIASSQDVRTDHKVARRVEGSTGADQGIPPGRLRIIGLLLVIGVRTAGEGMQDQDSVIPRRV